MPERKVLFIARVQLFFLFPESACQQCVRNTGP